MTFPPIDHQYLLDFPGWLAQHAQPHRFCHRAIDYTAKALSAFPALHLSRTRKGALVVTWPGSAAMRHAP